MSRSTSPSACSISSTSSITTLRNLYGSLADEFDVSTLETLDSDVLFNPLHAFADACYSDALADPFARLPSILFSSTPSPNSTPPTSPVGKRRSMWVHNGLGALEESSEEDEDEEDNFRPPSYSTLDKIAPWADGTLRAQTRPEAMIQFRRPSGASTLLDIELSEPYVSQGVAHPKARISFMDMEPDFPAPAYSNQKLASNRPFQSLRFASLPDVAPAPKSGKMKIGFGGLKRRL